MDMSQFQNLNVEKLVNPYLFVIVVCFIEFVKPFLPDNIESKLISILAVLVGTAIGFMTNVGVVAGFVTGFLAPGGIDFVMNKLATVRDTLFTEKNPVPVEPKK